MAARFVHLHLHTIYSLLDGAVSVDALVEEIRRWEVKAVAISDHGHLFGLFAFWKKARDAGIKPILGCEFYLVDDRKKRDVSQPVYHQLLLAMNEEGYRNLMRLASLAYLEGYFQKPRIDRALIAQYHGGLIATSSCPQGEIPQALLRGDYEEAVRRLRWWLEVFGDRFYIEVQRHGLAIEDRLNPQLLKLAREMGVPVVATNDVHYLRREDAEAHDVLLCIQTGALRNDPKRLRFETNEFYLKSPEEMSELFRDIPEAVENTVRIAERVEEYSLARPVLFPACRLPEGFRTPEEYLKHLVEKGARERYGDPLPGAVRERIDYEFSVIKRMGFAPYFLIIHEILEMARAIDCRVGPGRGSAAGSIIAYCLGITRIDPLKYNLLFERFLNPDRVSLPDIDIDFEDEKRNLLLQKIAERYGKEHVAQIITFTSIASRTAIRDVARVLDIPLAKVEEILSLLPEVAPNQPMPIEEALAEVEALRTLYERDETVRQCLDYARRIEGNIRQTGLHAAGVVIAPSPLFDLIPLAVHKDSHFPITQWEHIWLEEAGLIKMDILGLANLSIISRTLQLIAERHGKTIDIDRIPLDDEKTLELFRRGETIGTFQFESAGMRRYLRQLRPTSFEDIVAMVALYRPGPLEYIPSYIRRKHGEEEVTYLHPEMEPILKDTYGIMVYQEQLMMVAQRLAGFSPGRADTLRKAVAKKQKQLLESLRTEFIEGCVRNGIDRGVAEKIFADIEKFGLYGFNRSHAVAYAFLAFQTAYLKAHYPVEYMCALLDKMISGEKRGRQSQKLLVYIRECQRMGIAILPPDINESEEGFTIVGDRAIRFGLGAIKNVGHGVVQEILKERRRGGPFKNFLDFCSRVPKLNRRVVEALVTAGAFDRFGLPREAYFARLKHKNETLLEYGLKQTRGKQSVVPASGLFTVEVAEVRMPELGEVESWSMTERLRREREYLDVFVSGHPLASHRVWTALIPSWRYLSDLEELTHQQGGDKGEGAVYFFLGVVSEVEGKVSRKGQRYWEVLIEDFTYRVSARLYEESYQRLAGALRIALPVLIQAWVRPTTHEDFRLNIQEVFPLDELLGQMARDRWRLVIRLPLSACTEVVAKRLLQLFEQVVRGGAGSSSSLPEEVKQLHAVHFPERLPLYWEVYHRNGNGKESVWRYRSNRYPVLRLEEAYGLRRANVPIFLDHPQLRRLLFAQEIGRESRSNRKRSGMEGLRGVGRRMMVSAAGS